MRKEYTPIEEEVTRVCPMCEKEFTTHDKRYRYCSKECSLEAIHKAQKGYSRKQYARRREFERLLKKQRNSIEKAIIDY